MPDALWHMLASRARSDFYSGCAGFDAGDSSLASFISFVDLEGVEADLNGYAAACNADGGVTDAGATCTVASGDAGPDGG